MRTTAHFLGLPFAFLLLCHVTYATNLRTTYTTPVGADTQPSSATTTSTSVLKKFMTWPLRALSNDSHDDATTAAYPLFSTRERNYDDKHILFSFEVSGSALRRHRQRRARRAQQTTIDVSVALAAAEGNDNTAEDGTTSDVSEQSGLFDTEEFNGWSWCTRDDGTRYICGTKVDTAAVVSQHTDDDHSTSDHSGTAHDMDHSGGGTAHGVGTHSEEGHGDEHSDAHGMVVHVTYEDIYAILVFLIVATAAGIFTAKLGMPALVGEIFVGFLLGPPLADFVPFPEALVLVGEIGLIMLLLEAGVELDVAQLRETGTRALAIGCTGTILPLLVGMGLGMATGNGVSIKSALAVGASFSPTSLGVAASALKSGKMLDTPVGQLIVASCVVDDVLALILLSMFKVLVKDSPPIYEYFLPIISSLGFLVVLGGSAVTWLPRFIENRILKRCSDSYRELVMFSIMTLMLLAYLPLLNYTQASYLTGAFLAGCTFSQIDHAHHAFMEKTHQLMTWLLRVFFAASIGFQVPVKLFGDPYVIGWGFILYVCVLAKLPLAFYVPQFEDVKEGASYNPFLRDRIIAALAMTCRGEFSFIIAAFALGEGLFTAQMYAAIVWAVLLSCITSPFMLLNVIKYFNKIQLNYLASTNPIKLQAKDGEAGESPLFLHIKAKAPASGGMQEQFRKIVNELGLEVVERRTNRNGRGLDAIVQTDLYVRDTTLTVKLQKISAQKRIKQNLAHAMDQSGNSGMNKSMSFCKQGSVRVSSGNLSQLSLTGLEKAEQEALKAAAKEEDDIVKRSDLVEMRIEKALGEGADVIVDVWNPWPWTEVLDKICEHYGITADSSSESVETFVAVFDKIDADGGGSIDQEEMYEALVATGLDITEEGVLTLFAMIDDDGNGDIDRGEWTETIEFYLELKKEEAEMSAQQSDHADFMKALRAKKLEALGNASGGLAPKRTMERMASLDENQSSDEFQESGIEGAIRF